MLSTKRETSESTRIKQAAYLFLETLIPLAGNMEETELREHPTEIMIPVRRILAGLAVSADPEVDILTGPRWEMNFGFSEVWLAQAVSLKQLLGLDLSERRFILFTFPAWLKENVLLNCIVGHELGHNIDLETGISEVVLAEAREKQAFKNLLSRSDWYSKELKGNAYQHNERYLTRLLRQWIGELVADVIGMILLGPAFYYSAIEVDLIRGVASPYNPPSKFIDIYVWSHPRLSTRNMLRTRLLRERGFFSLLPEVIKKDIENRTAMWTAARSSPAQVMEAVPSVDWYVACDEVLREMEDRIVEQVELSLPESVHYGVEKYQGRADLLADYVGHLVPPCELNGEPVDDVTILNAGWLAYRDDQRFNAMLGRCEFSLSSDVIKGAEGRNQGTRILNNLVRKALSAARIHENWRQASATANKE